MDLFLAALGTSLGGRSLCCFFADRFLEFILFALLLWRFGIDGDCFEESKLLWGRLVSMSRFRLCTTDGRVVLGVVFGPIKLSMWVHEPEEILQMYRRSFLNTVSIMFGLDVDGAS